MEQHRLLGLADLLPAQLWAW